MSEHTNSNKLRIGISIGDINGIGLEVILKTLSDKRILNLCTPVIYGATKVMSYHKNIAKINHFPINNIKDITEFKTGVVNVVNCWYENVKITLGKCTEEGGRYAYASLEKAVEDLNNKQIDALVTAPINKQAMQLANFGYPGHTEYLSAKLNGKNSLMLMVHENLRVGLVTNHTPINEVANKITEELVLQKIETIYQTLRMDFGIERPTIAVLGLNPHASDGGTIGTEEQSAIIPAITAAKAKGIMAIGPYPADGLFGSGNYANFDGILAMFHDQGLTPFKALSFGGGVNFTGGLSGIRTSPDHGTGYDIVGQGIADESSFRQALYLAIDSAKRRAEFLEMSSNPLQEVKTAELANAEDEVLVDEDDTVNQPKPKKEPRKQHTHKKEQPKNQTKEKPQEKQLSVEERLALAEQKKTEEGQTNEVEQKTEDTE